ncbi:MAG: glycine dehydrogenase, partial [Thermoanaerobaculales bacterium]|nr:glycine dehydrogenase [Thermoanaerobaculales bacterium]
MHPWVGAGPEDRRIILSELGLESINELFASIPAGVCVDGLGLPPARDEDWIRRILGDMASANVAMDSVPCFLGAGVYRHVQPSVVDAVLSRAEFFTSYTPYQPEISQGTLQVIFEFQTLIS